MGTIRPLVKPNIVKKRTKKFIRHQSDRYLRVKVKTSLIILTGVNSNNLMVFMLVLFDDWYVFNANNSSKENLFSCDLLSFESILTIA